MVSAIRRLRDVTVEKKCAALRQWKMVHQFSVQAEGADRRKHDLLISQKNNMIKAGTSILTVWVKSRQRHACMKRFRNWKMHIFGILSQERTREQALSKVTIKSNRIARMIERQMLSQREMLRQILRLSTLCMLHLYRKSLAPIYWARSNEAKLYSIFGAPEP